MTYRWQNNVSAAALVMASASIANPCAALAQTVSSTESPASLNEIVVTAQKRAQNIQDVGVAVTAVTPAALNLIDKKDTTQLAVVVPSLQVQQYSPSIIVLNIRGVSQNDYSDYQEAPIAFYNDEVYIGALGAISGQNFDLERVEVLRGPQGTLFGRNATGGLVQIVTAKPTRTLQGYGTLTFGSYGQITSEAAISGPISNSFRFRLSETTDNHDGYYKNLYPGGQDGGSANFYGLRGQIEGDLSAQDTLHLKVEYLRNAHEHGGAINGVAAVHNLDGLGVPVGNTNAYGTCPGCTVFGYRFSSDPFVNNFNFPSDFNRSYWNLTGRYEHDFGSATLTSITNYQHLSKQLGQDVDASPINGVQVAINQRLFQLSEELRLSGKTDRFNWLLGLYGLKIKTQVHEDVFVDPLVGEFFQGVPAGTFASPAAYDLPQDTRSLAGFAQGEYKLSPMFSVIVGGRYSMDWKSYGYVHQTFGVVDYDFAARRPDLKSQRFGNWSGKIQLEVRPATDVLLYAGVNRGTKAGGFNSPRIIPQIFQYPNIAAYNAALAAVDDSIVFKQEVLTNYEGGFKLSTAGGKATFNGALFHYDYKNYQSYQNHNAQLLVVNVPARLTGLELEASLRPSRALTLSAFLTHMFDATVKNVALPGLQGVSPSRTVDRTMPQAPDWSIGWSGSLRVPVRERGALTLSTNWKYDSSQYFTVFNAPVDREPVRLVGNLRLSFTPPSEKWDAAFFINNVTDKVYRIYEADNASLDSVSEVVYARPRWFGGSLTFRLGNH